ncbi:MULTISPECIES: ornithine cyclodeaminase family protein [Streptomycetaceae]|uniref:Ornithine cyclodeaminase n=1 Tax=Streptantibioticus cattleyicolor (strain ATCC 35852 / DSM 46488 / JCM 4925 / NBRC 14057 / NRRL 8057) TaxID=1003195 RepID=F8K3D7_STREN|nr:MULTISPECIES: ornithine cyclodeaminase family protein [Streptomycetaceae]AEW95051.1 ornithine cyclodeaminase [Streptantibioticus cattleyicolor NRRL 8057 = DSM 46488]MYS59648.1 ornithine cyclodeaminase family protein [Streptomyces sp. SID5468]CCB75401.1 Ornithine cyclodeaminase [Streptantibioticus cattleyicolor NRRL 8057 = DSM 46488]
MLILDREAVTKALPMSEAVPVLAGAMRRYSAGLVTQPLRSVLRPATDPSMLGVMPAHMAAEDGDPAYGFGVKAVLFNPGNPARGLPATVGAVLLLDPETGVPAALLDAAVLTAVRTAAVSAVATDALARPDAGDLAILGSGAQARAHLEAMAEVRPVRRVRVWSRTAANAEAFAVWARQLLPGVEVEAAATVSAALAGADLVCTTTASHEPLVEAADLAPGAHVNAVGASVADARELTSAAVARCAIYVDSKESAANEAGDLRAPLAEGLIDAGRIRGELGEVLLGRAEGRRDEREITLYKSLGLAVQDVAAGFAALRGATERGLGTDVPFPG